MNFTTNWRDRRNVFTPTHYSIANYCTETKNEMKTSFGEDLFLPNLHLIPDPLMKNLADTIITEGKMAPKSKLQSNIDVKTSENMQIPSDYSPLSGITNFFSGVMSVISNAMFSKRKPNDFGADTGSQMAAPPMWQSAKVPDENKILQDEHCTNDMSSDLLVAEMTDCRSAVAQCQNKIEQVRQLLNSKPVPCNFRSRRRPKKVFVEAGSVEDCFEDAFSPEDFENIANDSYIQYSSPVCYHDHVFHEVDSPKVKIETTATPERVTESLPVCETTEIVKNVPEIETVNVNKLECDMKQEVVASCEDKLSRLKALLQERRKKTKTTVEPEPIGVPELKEVPKPASVNVPELKEVPNSTSVKVPELKEVPKPKSGTKVKDKRFKNPNRCCGKRMKSKMRKNIQDDLQFAHEISCDDLSSAENSPSMNNLEKYIAIPVKSGKDYFDEVSGRFHSASVTESEDSFQIVFNDSPRQRRPSDCESEDSFIVFEDSPDSCYTSNDVFGDSSDSEDYDSDSDLSDSGCGIMSFKLAASLSKSVCNLTDDSLYAEHSEDEVDCANVKEVTVPESVTLGDLHIDSQSGDVKSGLLLDDRKKLLRKDLPAKRVQFSEQPPKVHVMRVWSFAARQARAGHWERYALDRDRFKRRIADVEVAVSWVLKPQHRSRVMFQRFMPWWNAQKRKELADKKEREAQEKVRREEEELRAEEAKKVETEDLGSKEESGRDAGENPTVVATVFAENDEGPKGEVNQTQIQESNTNSDVKIDVSNCVVKGNYDLSSVEKVTECNENEINIDNKTSSNVDVTQRNTEIIAFNDKICDFNTNSVAHNILDT